MARFTRFVSLGALCSLLLTGCLPVASSWPVSGDSGGADAGPTSSGSQVSGNSSGSSSNDSLTAEFPGCLEPISGDAWRDEVLRLVNVERADAGLDPVTQNQNLEDQATQYACEMVYYNFFAHENPVTGTDLRDRAAEFGIRISSGRNGNYTAIGENLAAGQTTPAQAMADWMASEGHRENILNPNFTQLGVGVRVGGEYGTYWVQEFGRPR